VLGNLRISSKLLIMVGLSVLGIVAVAAVGLSALWSNLLEDRKNKLHDVVLLARQAIELNYQASHQAGISDADSAERGKILLRALHFGEGDNDYFYAVNGQGTIQAHPNPKMEGTSLYDKPDSDGVFFVREQMAQAAKGGGFAAFRFPRAGGDTPLPKIAYSVEFKPYG
jgi:methyl-accepting chemotaxis protein